ncbi:MAG: crossover junction endodeoxyribonuclease RuvC [Planctomycetaceae bacterium]
MNVLALDPANRTGFAHSDGYRGFVDLSRAVDTHPGQRLIRFSNWLEETLEQHTTELIAAEDASFGSVNPSVQAQHNELRGIIHLVAAEFGIDVKLFQPSTIKLHATGHGNAKKHAMVAACKRFLEIVPQDENEADALWILDLAKRPDCWPKQVEKRTKRATTLPPQKRWQKRML